MNRAWRSMRFGIAAAVALTAAVLTPTSSPAATCTGTPLDSMTTYLNWCDNASPGMAADNIHIVNTGTSPIGGCVTVGGQTVGWVADYGKETYVTMPPGTYGGPVRITVTNWLSGPGYTASQRVQFHSSFNELPALSPRYPSSTQPHDVGACL